MSISTSLDQLKDQLSATNSYAIAFTCILVWDWLALLPREVEHFWRSNKKASPVRIVYFAVRYGTLILQIINLTLVLAPIPKAVCGKVAWIEVMTLVYALLVCDALLALRVWALYEHSRKVLIGLCLLLALEAGVLIATFVQIYPIDLPEFIRDAIDYHGCLAGQYRGKYEVYPLISVCSPAWTNAILLFMTVYKSWKVTRELEGIKLPILKRLVHDGTLYFLAIVTVDLINIYFFNQRAAALKGFNTSASTVISSTLSCRLALSLFVKRPEPALSLPVVKSHQPRVAVRSPTVLDSGGQETCERRSNFEAPSSQAGNPFQRICAVE